MEKKKLKKKKLYFVVKTNLSTAYQKKTLVYRSILDNY